MAVIVGVATWAEMMIGFSGAGTSIITTDSADDGRVSSGDVAVVVNEAESCNQNVAEDTHG